MIFLFWNFVKLNYLCLDSERDLQLSPEEPDSNG